MKLIISVLLCCAVLAAPALVAEDSSIETQNPAFFGEDKQDDDNNSDDNHNHYEKIITLFGRQNVKKFFAALLQWVHLLDWEHEAFISFDNGVRGGFAVDSDVSDVSATANPEGTFQKIAEVYWDDGFPDRFHASENSEDTFSSHFLIFGEENEYQQEEDEERFLFPAYQRNDNYGDDGDNFFLYFVGEEENISKPWTIDVDEFDIHGVDMNEF